VKDKSTLTVSSPCDCRHAYLIGMYRPKCNAFVFLLLLLLTVKVRAVRGSKQSTTTPIPSTAGPIRTRTMTTGMMMEQQRQSEHRRGRNRRSLSCFFTWSAQVDRISGTASSKEVSSVTRIGNSDVDGGGDSSNAMAMVATTAAAKSLFESYPTWLTRGSTSLGWLKCVRVSGDDGKRKQASNQSISGRGGGGCGGGAAACQVRVRFLGVNLLSFGPPRTTTNALRHSRRTPFGAFNVVRGSTFTTTTTVLPITGGVLSLPGHNRRGQNNSSNNSEDRGALVFALTTAILNGGTGWGEGPTDQRRRRRRINNEKADDKNQRGKQQDRIMTVYTIQTNIVGYRPWLCGATKPVPALRANLYLHSQSIVHGYVMWRFHRRCRRKLLLLRSPLGDRKQ
jgi:hypothetical protein